MVLAQAPSWQTALGEQFEQPYMQRLMQFLQTQEIGRAHV